MNPSKQPAKLKNVPTSKNILVDAEQLAQHLVNEFIPLIVMSSSPHDQEELQLKAHRAITLFEELAPGDGVESMLARQMIGIHNAQHGCLYKAMHPEQSYEARISYLDKAARLSEVFLKQMQALDKHRGHASQRVTVEHVTVESGGQAIVGNVSQKEPKK